MTDRSELRDALYFNSDSDEFEIDAPIKPDIFEALNQRWSLLVLRELSIGHIRFNELTKTSGVNPNTLRDRLRDFERVGIVERRAIGAHPIVVEYRLTSSGAELGEMFRKFDDWHEKYFHKPVSKKSPKPRKPRSDKAVVNMEESAQNAPEPATAVQDVTATTESQP